MLCMFKKKKEKKENPLTSTPSGQGVYGGERQGVKGNVHDPEGTQHGRAPGGVEHRLHLHVVSAYRGLQQRLRTGPVGLSLSHRVNNAFRQQEAAIINRPGTDVSPCSGTGEGVVDFVLTPRYPPKWQKTLHISVFNVKSMIMPLQVSYNKCSLFKTACVSRGRKIEGMYQEYYQKLRDMNSTLRRPVTHGPGVPRRPRQI